MQKPPVPPKPKRVCAREPFRVVLNKGVYFWCACGYSRKQPYCDGSHRQTALQGVRFTVAADNTELYLCACKHTKSPPYCDGTHKLIPESMVEGILKPDE